MKLTISELGHRYAYLLTHNNDIIHHLIVLKQTAQTFQKFLTCQLQEITYYFL